MNATILKFGYPASLVCNYQHWCVLLRPSQVTLGALILAAKGEARTFAALTAAAFAELPTVLSAIESGLKELRTYDRINYLMLMMVDPHVHFHVVPRYATPQEFHGVSFGDPGWPGAPDLKFATDTPETVRNALLIGLRQNWNRG